MFVGKMYKDFKLANFKDPWEVEKLKLVGNCSEWPK